MPKERRIETVEVGAPRGPVVTPVVPPPIPPPLEPKIEAPAPPAETEEDGSDRDE